MSNQRISENKNDGLKLYNTYVTTALKCVPPGDKPTLLELRTCFNHFKQEIDQSKFRYTIDRKEDYILVLEILSRIKKRPIKKSDIIQLLTNKPELLKLNSNIIPNEGYIKSINED